MIEPKLSSVPIISQSTRSLRAPTLVVASLLCTLLAALVFAPRDNEGTLRGIQNPEGRGFPLLQRDWAKAVTVSDPCRMHQPTRVRSARNLLAQRPVLDDNVSNIFLVTQTLGIKEVLEALPFQHWHLAGQAIASLPCFQRNITAGLKLLDQMYWAVSSLLASGLRVPALPKAQHGAVWFLVGTHNSSWPYILSELCAPLNARHDCMHPTGHGFVIKHALTAYGPGSHDPSLRNVTALAEAVADCKAAPSLADRQHCATGVFHATAEYGDFSKSYPSTSAWMAPCDQLSMPPLCFFYLFSTGMRHHKWRRLSLSSTKSELVNLCSDQQMPSELHVRSCIYGLGAGGFPAFLRTAFLLRQQAGGDPHELCKHQAMEIVPDDLKGIEDELIFCNLIFKVGNGHSLLMARSEPNVFDWCSLLTSMPEESKGVVYYRWLACIAGSLGYLSVWNERLPVYEEKSSAWSKLWSFEMMASPRSSKPTTSTFFNVSKSTAQILLGLFSASSLFSWAPLAYKFCQPAPSHLNVTHVLDVCATSIQYATKWPANFDVLYE